MNVAEQKQTVKQLVENAVKDSKGITHYMKNFTVQYLENARKGSWNSDAKGLVVRVRTDGGYYSYAYDLEKWFDNLFKATPNLVLRSETRSEKTKKGSGYWGARGSYQPAATEYYTFSFWLTLKEEV